MFKLKFVLDWSNICKVFLFFRQILGRKTCLHDPCPFFARSCHIRIVWKRDNKLVQLVTYWPSVTNNCKRILNVSRAENVAFLSTKTNDVYVFVRNIGWEFLHPTQLSNANLAGFYLLAGTPSNLCISISPTTLGVIEYLYIYKPALSMDVPNQREKLNGLFLFLGQPLEWRNRVNEYMNLKV